MHASTNPGLQQPTRTAPARDFVAPPGSATLRQAPTKDWYAGVAFIQNFAFFTENHSSTYPGPGIATDTASHSAAPQISFSGFVGYRLDNNWHIGLEVGYFSEWSDTDCNIDNVCFKIGLSAPFAVVNATYNTVEQSWGWLYAGAGIGVAMPQVEESASNNFFIRSSQSNVSVMPQLLLGYRARVADDWFIDLGYRFSAFDAGYNANHAVIIESVPHTLSNEIGWVLNHSVRLGLAYEF